MNTKEPNTPESEEKYPWAGPALFTVVAVGLFVFFWWLVTIGPNGGH